ncbi:hypothetical protein PUN28_017181 [Cardiocondyla obscurior]|uniref:Uncharacterized protein n=1 Tax=Cardiocondyla obscurior TaxID=286306 RepID=A0AAW2EKL7_9HYME
MLKRGASYLAQGSKDGFPLPPPSSLSFSQRVVRLTYVDPRVYRRRARVQKIAQRRRNLSFMSFYEMAKAPPFPEIFAPADGDIKYGRANDIIRREGKKKKRKEKKNERQKGRRKLRERRKGRRRKSYAAKGTRDHNRSGARGWTVGRTDGRTDGPGGGNHKATMRRGEDGRGGGRRRREDGLGAASAASGSVSVNLT